MQVCVKLSSFEASVLFWQMSYFWLMVLDHMEDLLLQVMDFIWWFWRWCNTCCSCQLLQIVHKLCLCQNLYLVYETRLRKREDSFVQLANSKDYQHFENNAGNR